MISHAFSSLGGAVVGRAAATALSGLRHDTSAQAHRGNAVTTGVGDLVRVGSSQGSPEIALSGHRARPCAVDFRATIPARPAQSAPMALNPRLTAKSRS